MIHEIIELKNHFPSINSNAYLEVYAPSNFDEFSKGRKRKGLLILPGGAYFWLSDREAEPIAFAFLAHDFCCFVLKYSVGDFVFPYPIIEGFAAIAYIRESAEKYNVNPNAIGAIGFSAGGHLAATLACYSKDDRWAQYLGIEKSKIVVNFSVLSYPVVTMDKKLAHPASMRHITQNRADLIDLFSIEKHVDANFAPTYIWTVEKDALVPSENSKLLIEQFEKNHITYKSHIFENGHHGVSLADKMTEHNNPKKEYLDSIRNINVWVLEAINFIEGLFD